MTTDDNVVSYIINAQHPLSSKTNSLEYFKPTTNIFNADCYETMYVSLFLMLYAKKKKTKQPRAFCVLCIVFIYAANSTYYSTILI